MTVEFNTAPHNRCQACWGQEQLCLQISHPEDTRNFVAASEEHPAGRARRGYQSMGIFKDF